MDIINIAFEEKLTLCIKGELIQIVAFKMPEHGNIKFGVEAPRTVKVHREEVYQAIQMKIKEEEKEMDELVS